jgi:DNA-binding LytR/AlgR family response regulator
MKQKILIIEDDIGIRENISILLNQEGFLVSTANDGKEGIVIALSFKPDLIICDIMMPKMNGYEVLKILHAKKETAKIPFLFLTAKVEKNDIRAGMELGADDYLFKPVDISDLLNSIETRLNRFKTIKAAMTDDNAEQKVRTSGGKLIFKIRDHSEVVFVKDIIYISAARQYSSVYTLNKKKYLLKRSLSKWEEMLPSDSFIRIHRSTLINIDHINRIQKTLQNKCSLHLNNSQFVLEVSRRYLKNIKQFQ